MYNFLMEEIVIDDTVKKCNSFGPLKILGTFFDKKFGEIRYLFIYLDVADKLSKISSKPLSKEDEWKLVLLSPWMTNPFVGDGFGSAIYSAGLARLPESLDWPICSAGVKSLAQSWSSMEFDNFAGYAL